MQQLPLGVRLADHATFETFHAGDNTSAVAHLRGLADGTVAAASLFLAGPPGSGKSHLLQAVCAVAAAGGQRSPCGYLALKGLGPDRLSVALEGWQKLSLVAIDDLDHALGDRDAETALFRLYNGLAAANGTLLVGAQGRLERSHFALPDLASRLAAGLQVTLQPPSDADLTAALTLRAQARGLELPGATADWLLRRCRRDMHSLCELLDGLDEASLVAQRRLTVPFVREMLRLRDGARRPASP